MTDNIQNRLECLDGAGRRSWRIQDEASTSGSGGSSTQSPETVRVAQSHSFGQARGLSLQDLERALGGEISGTEARAARGHDQPFKSFCQLGEAGSHRFNTIGNLTSIDDNPPIALKTFNDCIARAILSGSADHPIGDRDHLDVETGWRLGIRLR